jgi:hypothetical protein
MESPRVIAWKQGAAGWQNGYDSYQLRIFHARIEYEYVQTASQYFGGRTSVTPVLLDNKRFANITEERILMAIRLTSSVIGDFLPGPTSHVKDWLIDFLTM